MENEQEINENVTASVVVTEEPKIEAPNSMTNPTTPEIKSTITNEQLNQLISKMDAISNQQILIYEQMKEQKENKKGGEEDVIKY